MTMQSVAGDVSGAEVIEGRSLWQDAKRRFLKNKAAVVSAFVFLFLCIFAFFGQFLSQYDRETIDFTLMGANAYKGVPSFETGHYFGVDSDGRDLYARTVQGLRISIMIGIVGSLVAGIVGTLYGATAGYLGGRVDGIMMRTVDVLMSIPFMFVLILMLVMFGRSITILFIGVGLISWLDMSRIVRGQTLSIKNKEFVEAAVAIGVSPAKIILRHIVPNLIGVVVVYMSLLVPTMILTESFISFLGLGVQEPNTSLGALLNRGAGALQSGVTTWQFYFPLTVFIVLLFALFFIGDGLRDALDPKDR